MLRRKILGVVSALRLFAADVAFAPDDTESARQRLTASAKVSLHRPKEVIDKIRDEGMNRSQVMQHSQLSDRRDRRPTDQFAEHEAGQ